MDCSPYESLSIISWDSHELVGIPSWRPQPLVKSKIVVDYSPYESFPTISWDPHGLGEILSWRLQPLLRSKTVIACYPCESLPHCLLKLKWVCANLLLKTSLMKYNTMDCSPCENIPTTSWDSNELAKILCWKLHLLWCLIWCRYIILLVKVSLCFLWLTWVSGNTFLNIITSCEVQSSGRLFYLREPLHGLSITSWGLHEIV